MAATDTDANIYAAFRYRSGGSSTYSYQIMKSTDGGLNWSVSLSQVDNVSNNRIVMALAPLTSGKMLFAYALYESPNLQYRVFDGTSWGSVQTASSTNMGTNTIKQISADSINSTKTAYVAYLSSGNSGSLYVARFANTTGAFEGNETATTSGSHQLPSITISFDDIIHIYTVSSGKLYETRKNASGWQAPVTPYGDTFYSINELTSQISGFESEGVFWREGSSAPYTLKYDGRFFGIGGVICWQYISNSQHCSDSKRLGSGTVKVETPDPQRSYWVKKKACGWVFKVKCVNTSVFVQYPSTFTEGGRTYNFVSGYVVVTAAHPLVYQQSKFWTGGNSKIFKFYDVPRESLLGWDMQVTVSTILVYESSCGCRISGKLYTHVMILYKGYDKTK